MPSFTPEQLADVYVSRWQIRDMTNWFIRELKPVRMNWSDPPKLIRTVGFQVKIRRHEFAADWQKEIHHGLVHRLPPNRGRAASGEADCMTDFNTIERIARQLCEERGLDYDAKGRKRAHWLARARRIVAMAESHPVVETLARACGWRI